jgi:negative regulator of flagellin synthesis FlgM
MHRKSSVPKMEANLSSKKLKKVSQLKKDSSPCSNDDMQHEMAVIEKILEQTPDIREEKVAALRKAIESGSYVIHSKKIAERMIKESLFDLYLQLKDKR